MGDVPGNPQFTNYNCQFTNYQFTPEACRRSADRCCRCPNCGIETQDIGGGQCDPCAERSVREWEAKGREWYVANGIPFPEHLTTEHWLRERNAERERQRTRADDTSS